MAINNKPDFRVLVIGAGPTGLLIGQGLKHAGIDYRIYERIDDHTYQNRQRDWSMALHWGSEFLQTCLAPDLLVRLKEAETDPTVKLTEEQEIFTQVHNGKTGELILNVPTTSTRRVSRERFRKLLEEGLDIRHGSKIIGIDDSGTSVTATFEDGHVATGQVLIGCDSANSFVRTYLLEDQKAATEIYPVTTYNFTCKYTAEQATFIRNSLHPIQKNAVHPDTNTWYVLPTCNVPDPDDPSSWVFQHFFNIWSDEKEDTPKTSAERLAHFKSIASQHCEPWHSASQWVPDDTYVTSDKIRHWPSITRWDNHGGRISLAGDAAHPMVPFRGQGLNNGLQDAALYVQSLVGVLAKESTKGFENALEDAVSQYDAEVFERGKKEIEMSAKQGYLSMHFDQFMLSPLVKHGLNKVRD